MASGPPFPPALHLGTAFFPDTSHTMGPDEQKILQFFFHSQRIARQLKGIRLLGSLCSADPSSQVSPKMAAG